MVEDASTLRKATVPNGLPQPLAAGGQSMAAQVVCHPVAARPGGSFYTKTEGTTPANPNRCLPTYKHCATYPSTNMGVRHHAR